MCQLLPLPPTSSTSPTSFSTCSIASSPQGVPATKQKGTEIKNEFTFLWPSDPGYPITFEVFFHSDIRNEKKAKANKHANKPSRESCVPFLFFF